VVITEDEVLLMGHNSIQQVKHTLDKPNRHLAEILSGDAEGSTIEQIFEKTEDGTRVKINADFKLKGKLKLIGFMIKNKIKFGLESSIFECADSIDESNS
jgi:carbon monoxide dehydrogenase subunit G